MKLLFPSFSLALNESSIRLNLPCKFTYEDDQMLNVNEKQTNKQMNRLRMKH